MTEIDRALTTHLSLKNIVLFLENNNRKNISSSISFSFLPNAALLIERDDEGGKFDMVILSMAGES